MAVVQQPIKSSRSHHRVPEDLTPVYDAPVAGQQAAAALMAMRDKLGEQVCFVLFQGQVAQLVHDEKLGLAVVRQPFLQMSFACALAKEAAITIAGVTNTE